ncbi:MAG: lactonase family protein [Chloroflexota bacterium]|nr:lactonase family protein [Chloroflexota bacterium]
MRSRIGPAIAASVLILATVGVGSVAAGEPPEEAGAVFTMSNGATRNRVLAWTRADDGSLAPAGRYDTGGRGSGTLLANQGGLFLTPNGKWLYVVNPGSDQISLFRARGTSLTLTDVVDSRGDRPFSVVARGSLVYVLNNGGSGNIRGFRRTGGQLDFIRGSGRPLSGANTSPVQVGFSVDGSWLVVTELATDRLTRYAVALDGTPGDPKWQASAGAEPFGFDFAPDGTLVVSEAGDHVPGGSSASSYRFNTNGKLVAISAAEPTHETAACWTAVTPDGRYAYVTNTPDGSITGFAIDTDGSLGILDDDGVTAATGSGSLPLDLDTSRDGRFLYVLVGGTNELQSFTIAADGSLSPRMTLEGLPGAANGLVAR